MSIDYQNDRSEAEDVLPLKSGNVLLCPNCITVPLGQRWYQLRFILACGYCGYGYCEMSGREVRK